MSISGCSWDGRSIPGITGYPYRGKGELCPSRDDPGMVGVSWESQDTQSRGVGELCPSQDDLVMVGSIPGIPKYSQTEGGELCPSRGWT